MATKVSSPLRGLGGRVGSPGRPLRLARGRRAGPAEGLGGQE